jgi:hypothetical protein
MSPKRTMLVGALILLALIFPAELVEWLIGGWLGEAAGAFVRAPGLLLFLIGLFRYRYETPRRPRQSKVPDEPTEHP